MENTLNNYEMNVAKQVAEIIKSAGFSQEQINSLNEEERIELVKAALLNWNRRMEQCKDISLKVLKEHPEAWFRYLKTGDHKHIEKHINI